MARMMGHRPPDRWERLVYDELAAQLPTDWIAIASVAWSERSRGSGGGTWVRDGQADFVVLVPNGGICVVEVKGSRRVRVMADGRWCREERGGWREFSPRTPMEQATGNAHQISAIVQRSLGGGAPAIRFGYLVVFPQGDLAEGKLLTFDSTCVAFRGDLKKLRLRVTRALDARGPESAARDFDASTCELVAQRLVNHPTRIEPVDGADEVLDDSRSIDVLTRQQFAALEGIFEHPRVAVTGPAGSGKTVLALWRVRALVEQGRRPLFLCFNRMLAQHLRSENPDIAESIHNVDAYFSRLVGSRPAAGADLDRYFAEDLPGMVIDRITLGGEPTRVDDLVIDEGQDFGEMRLWAARELIGDAGSYLYCSDDRQDLYDRAKRAAVGAEVVFSLVHNCRNTVRINETSNRVLRERVEPMPGLPEGVECTVESVPDARAMAKEAWRLADSWNSPGSRVAILSPYRLENSCMASAVRAYNRELVEDLGRWDEQRTVLFSTIRSFKGLEADAVVVVDIDTPDESPVYESDMYVATTRGRSRLAVLCRSPSAAEWLAHGR